MQRRVLFLNYLSGESIHDDVHSKFCVVFCKKALVSKVVVPFAAIVFVAVEEANPVIEEQGLKVIMDQIISPAIQFKAGIWRSFFEMKEA